MPRVKRGVMAIKKRRKLMKLVKGHRGARSRHMRTARESLLHSLSYSYIHRRNKKRDFRSLWIIQINAAARLNGISYNNLICGLKNAGSNINRKILADLAINNPSAFKNYVDLAKEHLDKEKPKTKPRTTSLPSAIGSRV